MNRPLSGIRVTGIEQDIAGPCCSLLLADAGAEVIKIERPGTGDPRRSIPPFVERDGIQQGAGFLGYNRNKKSLALDFACPRGREIYARLVAASDVVVENLRPGSLDRQGLGHAAMRALHPRLIWAIISGFGRSPGLQGPYADRPAFDIVAEAVSGIMHQVGFAGRPPSPTVYGMADVCAGIITAHGIMQALFVRERTGQGQVVDSAMLDSMRALNEQAPAICSASAQIVSRGRLKNAWPRGAFQTRDGFIALNIPDDIMWARLCEVIGRPDLVGDPRSKTGPARSAHAEFLRPIIEEWLARKTRAEAVDALNKADIPTGPVYTVEDVFADPHIEARGMLVDVGGIKLARTVPHLSSHPHLPVEPAPRLGQHTRPILQGLLGCTAAEVDALIEAKVVQTHET